jgi:hypothetical protein
MTKKNTFKRVAENKSQRRNLKIGVNNASNGNVRFYRKNIPKNNVYATYTNKGNTLNAHLMYTNENHEGKKYQQNFLRLAINSAKNAGYKNMTGISVYVIPPNNNRYGNMPPSSYIFRKFGFKRQTPNKPGNNSKGLKQKIKWALNF